MDEARFEVVGPNDGFHIALRRQGWHLTGYKPVYADPHVIRPMPIGPWGDKAASIYPFYEAFGDNTNRKVLRAVIVKPRTREELQAICGNNEKLESSLAFLRWSNILSNDGDLWMKGSACQKIDNTGPTLEWFVDEWFRRELAVPARHGVTLEEITGGGDLDVIAFVNNLRVFVECKTGKPENIVEDDIRQFLQRAHQFGPEIAVFLIDTESAIRKPVTLVAQIIEELNWLDANPEQSGAPSDVLNNVRPADVPPGYNEL